MKTKDNKLIYSIIAALVIVVIFIFVFSLFSILDNKKINITFYNEFGRTKTIKINSGKTLQGKIENVNVDGYEFLGWFYDDELKNKVNENDIFNDNHILIAGFSKIITKTYNTEINTNTKYLTIETDNYKLTENDLITILNNKPKYLNLFNSEIEENIFKDNLFENQTNIQTIILPQNLETIGKFCFKNCYSLKEIVFNEKLKNIDNSAFYNCVNLSEVDLKNNIEFIGSCVFEGVSKLNKININKNVLTILPKAFYGSKIQEIIIDKENPNYKLDNNILYTSDYKNIIYALPKTSGNLILNESLEKIEDYAFYGCDKIQEITILNNIKNIGISAFENCYNLENVKFKESIEYVINNKAFKNCYKLKSVIFDVGLKSLENNVFENCFKLEIIDFKISTNLNICNIENIGNSVFKNCKNLNSFSIPDSVYNIGIEIFNSCVNLKNVNLSARLKNIPYKMFYNNKNLNKVVATSQIENIDDYAFYGCENLINISTLNDAKYLGFAVFKNCKNLNNIDFNNVKVLNEEVFYGCENLSNINVNNVEEIKKDSFAFSGITSFIINEKVVNINKDAFSSAYNLELFEINNNSNFIVEDGVLYNKDKTIIICYPNNKNNESYLIKSDIIDIYGLGFIKNQNLKNINVEEDNLYYFSENGILFSKDKETLIKYPNGKTEKTVSVSNKVINISEFALAYNKNIETLIIPNSVNYFDKNILFESNKIKSLTIPFIGATKNIEKINTKFIGYLFGGETYLTNNTYVPSSLKNVILTNSSFVSEFCFYEASKINYIELNDGVKVINKYAFYGCDNLLELYFNGIIDIVREKAIYNLKSLETINIIYNENLELEKDSLGEIKHSVSVYIKNTTGQNIPQVLKNAFRAKFFSIYSLTKNWKWFY